MDCSTPGFPALHCLLEFAHTHVHWVGDAIWPPHPLLPSSPLAFNHFQHQGLFQWVIASCQAAKVLDFSFSISPSNEYLGLIFFRIDWLDLAVWRTLRSLPQNHTLKEQFLGILSSLWSNCHIHTWILETPWLWLYGLLLAKWCLWFWICCLVLS